MPFCVLRVFPFVSFAVKLSQLIGARGLPDKILLLRIIAFFPPKQRKKITRRNFSAKMLAI